MHSPAISPASDEQHAADEDVMSAKMEQSELCGPFNGFHPLPTSYPQLLRPTHQLLARRSCLSSVVTVA